MRIKHASNLLVRSHRKQNLRKKTTRFCACARLRFWPKFNLWEKPICKEAGYVLTLDHFTSKWQTWILASELRWFIYFRKVNKADGVRGSCRSSIDVPWDVILELQSKSTGEKSTRTRTRQPDVEDKKHICFVPYSCSATPSLKQINILLRWSQ